VSQFLRLLISWTDVRAASGSAQNPGSACSASSVCRRSDLPVRSKKVSEFSDPTLQVGQSVNQLRHALSRRGFLES
jgi:hypothetical protein